MNGSKSVKEIRAAVPLTKEGVPGVMRVETFADRLAAARAIEDAAAAEATVPPVTSIGAGDQKPQEQPEASKPAAGAKGKGK